MDMNKVSKNILRVTEEIVRIAVEKEKQGWPPICATLLHQPKRPSEKVIEVD